MNWLLLFLFSVLLQLNLAFIIWYKHKPFNLFQTNLEHQNLKLLNKHKTTKIHYCSVIINSELDMRKDWGEVKRGGRHGKERESKVKEAEHSWGPEWSRGQFRGQVSDFPWIISPRVDPLFIVILLRVCRFIKKKKIYSTLKNWLFLTALGLQLLHAGFL